MEERFVAVSPAITNLEAKNMKSKESPATAYNWAVHLNDKFSLDGRDENGYMGIAWCFGMHDTRCVSGLGPYPLQLGFGVYYIVSMQRA